MSYKGLETAGSTDTPHLGGNVKVGDPYTYCPSSWDYILSRFCISSVLDLGSGRGHAAYFFHTRGLKVLAIDGFKDNVKSSIYPAIVHDITKSPVIASADLVHCQEVVEHIEEKYIDNLILSMMCGSFILMTHALPGQAGYHHVNLQTMEYWVDKFSQAGCSLLEEDTRRVRALAEKDGSQFLAKTGLLFVNNAKLQLV